MTNKDLLRVTEQLRRTFIAHRDAWHLMPKILFRLAEKLRILSLDPEEISSSFSLMTYR